MLTIIPVAISITITLSAFLLFQVQPLFARIILPWFGGSPSVWITVLVFFQCLLLFGYIYADILVRKLTIPVQLILHLTLVCAALLLLNFSPAEYWKEVAQISPVSAIFKIMAIHIAFPYFLLSATAPLLQGWLAATNTKQPLKFYALSNAASLAALLSFPLVFEPVFGTKQLINIWSYGFLCFAGSILLAAGLLLYRYRYRNSDFKSVLNTEALGKFNPWSFTLWTLFSMVGVMLLLSVTSFLSHDIAAVPLLWVLPLSVYLLSFILAFSSEQFYHRKFFIPGGVICVLLFLDGRAITPDLPFSAALTYTLICFFIWCMICHGELVRLRPATDSLTLFYLALSLGGAIGGLSVGILAPVLFDSFCELPISLILLSGLLIAISLRAESGFFGKQAPRRYRTTLLLSFLGLILATSSKLSFGKKDILDQSRNFYGVLQVRDRDQDDPSLYRRIQQHGQIVHGSQFQLSTKKLSPTEYYGRQSGLGATFKLMDSNPALKIGIVGLGVGTIKVYAREKDEFVIYEINPAVLDQAKKYFTFLDETPGNYRVVLGDGRLALEREVNERFDILVLDAFSSDSIPVHLLTIEAFELYLKRLRVGGVLAVHVSNRHLDVAEVVLKIAETLSIENVDYVSNGSEELGTSDSEWILISDNKTLLEKLKVIGNAGERRSKLEQAWSDDFSNLVSILQ